MKFLLLTLLLLLLINVVIGANPTPIVTGQTTTPQQQTQQQQPPPPSAPRQIAQTTVKNFVQSNNNNNNNNKYRGNVNIARVLQAKEIITGNMLAANLTVQSNFDCAGLVTAQKIKATSLAAELLVTSSLTSPSGTIIVNGDLLITHSQPQVRATAFIAEDIVIGGVKQWKLVRHDDFQHDAQGWSLLETSSCASAESEQASRDMFLGGPCKLGLGAASKVFDRLPPHNQVRVTARVHMIDNWQSETAFLQLDNHYVWTHRASPSSSSSQHGVEMCGHKDYPETKFSLPVDVVLKHDASFLQVAFGVRGTTAQQQHDDACQRSLGVDDVMIYVR